MIFGPGESAALAKKAPLEGPGRRRAVLGGKSVSPGRPRCAGGRASSLTRQVHQRPPGGRRARRKVRGMARTAGPFPVEHDHLHAAPLGEPRQRFWKRSRPWHAGEAPRSVVRRGLAGHTPGHSVSEHHAAASPLQRPRDGSDTPGNASGALGSLLNPAFPSAPPGVVQVRVLAGIPLAYRVS